MYIKRKIMVTPTNKPNSVSPQKWYNYANCTMVTHRCIFSTEGNERAWQTNLAAADVMCHEQ
jgi:hypothetical protein